MGNKWTNGKRGASGGIRRALQRSRLGELMVAKGKITPSQLHQALKSQKDSSKQLGEILLELGLVAKKDIRNVLLQQTACRALAVTLAVFIGVASFSAPKARATSTAWRDTNTGGYAAATQPLLQKVAFAPEANIRDLQSYPRLFGTNEQRSADTSAFTKWKQTLSRLSRADNSVWSSLSRYKGQELTTIVEAVNSYVNRTRYIEDSSNWGRSDYWATPAEFISRGGDCEDFAIAKYAALKHLGVPESRMRLAIVQDTIKNIPHAVLIVYTDGGPVVLDNQVKSVMKADYVSRYKPVYSINANFWWRHVS